MLIRQTRRPGTPDRCVALENAVSVAGTLLLVEATLTEVRDEDANRRHISTPNVAKA
jgi:hypothetical protein